MTIPQSAPPPASGAASRPRRPYRVPVGLPGAREDWRAGSFVSLLFHALIVLLIIGPLFVVTDVIELPQGAGGPGPAGGGGGGLRGTGSIRAEAIKFVQTAPPQPKVEPVVPKIEIKPPEPVLPELPQLKFVAPKEPTLTMPVGVGGGTGADGTAGSGPGTGGGVGSGVGTGRGSAVGPGTGGGGEANYPPSPIELFLPPLPVPNSVRGHHLIAEFDVDEKGKVLSVVFNETRDRGYNGRLREVLKGYRFRPGTRPDGTPIRMKTQIVADLY